jgi:hypothetical protein
MMWFKIAWGLISGNLGTITTAITGALGKFSDNETTRVVAQVNAATETWKARVDLFKGMWVTQWLIAAALIPPLTHQGMIYLDTSPFPYVWVDGWFLAIKMHVIGSWGVPQAPGDFHAREWAMIASLLGIQGALTVASTALRIFGRRS